VPVKEKKTRARTGAEKKTDNRGEMSVRRFDVERLSGNFRPSNRVPDEKSGVRKILARNRAEVGKVHFLFIFDSYICVCVCLRIYVRTLRIESGFFPTASSLAPRRDDGVLIVVIRRTYLLVTILNALYIYIVVFGVVIVGAGSKTNNETDFPPAVDAPRLPTTAKVAENCAAVAGAHHTRARSPTPPRRVRRLARATVRVC